MLKKSENGINEKTYYYGQRRKGKEFFGQIKLSQITESHKPVSVSFAEIPVIPAQSKTTLETSFHADAFIQTGSTSIGLSNSISDFLLERIMRGLGYARQSSILTRILHIFIPFRISTIPQASTTRRISSTFSSIYYFLHKPPKK